MQQLKPDEFGGQYNSQFSHPKFEEWNFKKDDLRLVNKNQNIWVIVQREPCWYPKFHGRINNNIEMGNVLKRNNVI